MLVGLATGTAVYLTALPPPPVPTITAGNSWKDDTKLAQVQRTIQEAVKRNRELYRLKPPSVRFIIGPMISVERRDF